MRARGALEGAGWRGAVSGGMLLLGILLSISWGSLPQADAVRLGALAAAALVSRGLFAAGWQRRALGPFADPLDLVLGLGLNLCALGLTGGVRSELYVLLLLDLVLARGFLGAAASRFLAAATLLGLAVLAALAPAAAGVAPAPLSLGLRLLWPVALLAAMELWDGSRGRDSGHERTTTLLADLPHPERSGPSEARPARDTRQEILHDLRSPLTVIRLYADLLSERARKGEPPLEEHLHNLRSEIDLMESLLAGEADSPGAESPWASRADLVKILSRLASSYRLAHSDRLRIEFIAEEPELPIVADVLALQRAVRNVLDNAVKYTPPGGEVRIRAGARNGQAFVVVSDTGRGMTPEEQARAFEFSFRGEGARASDARGEGLGLGLSRELLEANGGRISISSEPGRGSDVTIFFPLARQARR